MALLLEDKFGVNEAWDYLKNKYSYHKLNNTLGVKHRRGEKYRSPEKVMLVYLDECYVDRWLITKDNYKFVFQCLIRFWEWKDNASELMTYLLDKFEFEQEYLDDTFKKSRSQYFLINFLWDRISEKCKKDFLSDLKPGRYGTDRGTWQMALFLHKKGIINFTKKEYSSYNWRSYLPDAPNDILKQLKFKWTDDVIKMFAQKQYLKEYQIKFLFEEFPEFRDKVAGNKKYMLMDTYSSWNKFVDYWPREYQQPLIDELLEEFKEKRKNNPKKKKEFEKPKEEVFVERTEFSREFFESCLPEVRKLTMGKKKLFNKKDYKDKDIIDTLEFLFKIKAPHTGTMKYEVTHEFDFKNLVQESYVKKYVDKYKKEPFNPKKVRDKIEKEAFNLIGIKKEDVVDVSSAFYWIQDKDAKRIFGATIQDKVMGNGVMNAVIYGVTQDHLKSRNIEGVKYARDFKKEDLIGKFVVTENNLLSGFRRGTMTLKYIGYLVGEIKENRYGERHGYDNFWDDKVPERNYLVIKLENNTGAKELERAHWKKSGHLYAIDLTRTLQVFDTAEEAREIAAQLNEEVKDWLTLDH